MSASLRPLVLTPFNHVAVTVTDIHFAMKWYENTLKFERLAGPILIDAQDGSLTAVRLKEIFGQELKKLWMCHMISGNGTGIELFEFIEPKSKRRQSNFEYSSTGFFHICVTDPEIDDLVRRIAETGGKRRTRLFETRPGKCICFCEDPFGNVIEIYSHPYEEFWRGT